jgi:hypothetical protein
LLGRTVRAREVAGGWEIALRFPSTGDEAGQA